jgi:hypothetical protein
MKRICFLFLTFLVFSTQLLGQGKTYFPNKPKDTAYFSAFTIKWYSEQLSAMQEPVLFSYNSTNEIYRFTWLRTFHHPIAIRIKKNGDSYFLYWKECGGKGGYEPGELIKDGHKVISKISWYEFMDRLNRIDFWKMNTKERSLGNDGAEWILEGKSGKNYHVTDRWTPNALTGYYRCCDFLIGLANLKIPPKDKY